MASVESVCVLAPPAANIMNLYITRFGIYVRFRYIKAFLFLVKIGVCALLWHVYSIYSV